MKSKDLIESIVSEGSFEPGKSAWIIHKNFDSEKVEILSMYKHRGKLLAKIKDSKGEIYTIGRWRLRTSSQTPSWLLPRRLNLPAEEEVEEMSPEDLEAAEFADKHGLKFP